MRKTLALVAGLAVVHFAPDASAQEFFGGKGQVSLNSSGTSLAGHIGLDPAVLTPFVAFGRTSQPGPTVDTPVSFTETSDRRTVFLLNPGIDVFVIDHLSIGGEVLLGIGSSTRESKTTDKRNGVKTTTEDDGPSSTTFGFMPRIGYNIPLGRSFSIWPRGGFGFVHSSIENRAGNVVIESSEKFWLLYADVLFNWHPTPSFFLGIGPGFSHSLARTSKSGNVTVDDPSITTFRFLSFAIGGVIN